jgi:hypothetical protein
MPAFAASRYPCARVLLPRTRLAYVHLRNLLTDAKRDRAARVSGYVAVWLPEELLILYLLQGELVNATVRDAKGSQAIALARAVDKVPAEPEYGEICFHEADNEQLAAMYLSQTTPSDPWPTDLKVNDPAILFPFLMSVMFDGVVEIVTDGSVNFLVFRAGAVERAFLAVAATGSIVERVAKLFAPGTKIEEAKFRRWPAVNPLPVQAPKELVSAYRELANALVQRLTADGRAGAPAIAEQARQNLLKAHPDLECFSIGKKSPREPIADTARITAAVASWLKEIIFAGADHAGTPPETLLKDLTWERRHMFQSAGFYEKLPWKVM